MCPVSDRTASYGRCDFNSEDSTAGATDGRGSENSPKNIITAANRKVRLINILNHYGIKLVKTRRGDWSQPIICPLKSHKGANERTASFGYNFIQDRFNCFGCGASGRAVEFIALREGKSKLSVAKKILEKYSGYADEAKFDSEDPKIEEMLLELSAFINRVVQRNKNDNRKIENIHKVLWWFDNYLIANVPKSKIVVEELEYRISKVRELLSEDDT